MTKTKTKPKQKTPSKRLTSAEKAKMRVRIARDVLKHLDTQFLGAVVGSYVDLNFKCSYDYEYDYFGKDLKQVLDKDVKKCYVCAKGALFISHVRRFDQVVFNHNTTFPGESDVVRPLLRYFSQRQLDMIECAYEGADLSGDFPGSVILSCQNYYALHRHDRTRLQAIAHNIIRNKGTFDPKDLRRTAAKGRKHG